MDKQLQETAAANYATYVSAVGGILKTLSWPEFTSSHRYAIPDEYRTEFGRCTEFDFIDLSPAPSTHSDSLIVGREGGVPIFLGSHIEIAVPVLMGNGYPKPARVMFDRYLPKSHVARASGHDLILNQALRVEAISTWFLEAAEWAKRIPGYPSAYQKSLFPELKAVWNLFLGLTGLWLTDSLAVLPETKVSYLIRTRHSRDMWISVRTKGVMELEARLCYRALSDEPIVLDTRVIRFESASQLSAEPLEQLTRWISNIRSDLSENPASKDRVRDLFAKAGDVDRDLSYMECDLTHLEARLKQLYWYVKKEVEILENSELMHQ